MARENVPLQIATLADTYRLLITEGDITRAQLKARLITAQAVMEEGTEINSLGFEGGNTAGVVMYPKEVVLAACLEVLKENPLTGNPGPAYGGADSGVVHMDFSWRAIES